MACRRDAVGERNFENPSPMTFRCSSSGSLFMSDSSFASNIPYFGAGWSVCRSRNLLYWGRFLSTPKGACSPRDQAFHPDVAFGGAGGSSTPVSSKAPIRMGDCIFGPVWVEFQVQH